jgi:Spy/CpxP family protein refolding chaperone
MRARALAAIATGALCLAAALGPAAAQPRRGPPAAAARREELKKQIRAMRAYKLTSELGLDEATATRLFPVFARFDDETDKLVDKRVDLQRRLNQADAMPDARAVDRLIDEAVANQRALRDLEDRRLTELRKILTPPQVAKLLVVLPAMERQLQNQLRQAIIKASRPGKAGKALRPDDDRDDDDIEPDEARPRRAAPTPADRRAPGGSNAPGNTAPQPRP